MKSPNVGGRVPLCLSFLIPVEGTQQGSPDPHGFGGGHLGVVCWGEGALGVPQQCLGAGGHRIIGCSSWRCRIPLGLPENFRVSPP